MNDIIQAIVGILGGGTLGGIAGAISATIATRQKIKEIEFTYKQKLQENQDINISLQVETLYKPINIKISKLLNDSNRYEWNLSSSKQQAETDFRVECEKFILEMIDIYDRGADIYLTAEVDKHLRHLTFFLKRSLDCTKKVLFQRFFIYLSLSLFPGIFGLTLARSFGFLPKAPISTLIFRMYLHRIGGILKRSIKKAVLTASPPIQQP